MLACTGHELPEKVEALLAEETDPQVRIALAEALGHAGNPDHSVALLVSMLDGENHPRLRLQAVEALIYLPLRPRILALAAATRAAADIDEYVRGAAEYLRLRLTGRYEPESRIFRFDLYSGGPQAGMTHSPQAASLNRQLGTVQNTDRA